MRFRELFFKFKKKNYLGKPDENRGIVLFCVIFLMLSLVVGGIIVINRHRALKEEEGMKSVGELSSIIEKDIANINTYAIYGNILRFEGKLIKANTNSIISTLKTVELVLKDKDGDRYVYDLKYYISTEGIDFYFDENHTINKGINLDEIEEGEYFAFLRITYSSTKTESGEKYRYYTLKNCTEYTENIEYYTTSDRNGENRKLDLLFSSSKDIESFFSITSTKVEITGEIYDIIIDAGHGGNDSGAVSGNEYESSYTLEYAKLLKESLEKEGYKVKLTRDIDERTPSYGTNGRAILPFEVKAKLILSIHLNSDTIDVKDGGVEIYCSNKLDLEFAKSFASEIVKFTGTRYSTKTPYKKAEGVYVRTYTSSDIKEAIEYANELGFSPYESITTETPYFFIIRETGGISTKAYIDGRNTQFGENPYFNSNVGVESYLIELGYINSKTDFERIKSKKEEYVSAITNAIISHYRKDIQE